MLTVKYVGLVLCIPLAVGLFFVYRHHCEQVRLTRLDRDQRVGVKEEEFRVFREQREVDIAELDEGRKGLVRDVKVLEHDVATLEDDIARLEVKKTKATESIAEHTQQIAAARDRIEEVVAEQDKTVVDDAGVQGEIDVVNDGLTRLYQKKN